MRTEDRSNEYLTSYMESAPMERDPRFPDDCGMCMRNPAPDVLSVRFSRNGTQSFVIVACAECRRELMLHFLARRDPSPSTGD